MGTVDLIGPTKLDSFSMNLPDWQVEFVLHNAPRWQAEEIRRCRSRARKFTTWMRYARDRGDELEAKALRNLRREELRQAAALTGPVALMQIVQVRLAAEEKQHIEYEGLHARYGSLFEARDPTCSQ